VPRRQDDEALAWLLIGGFLGLLAGAVMVGGQKQAEISSCPSCSKPVPRGAPICPWCRIPLIWAPYYMSKERR